MQTKRNSLNNASSQDFYSLSNSRLSMNRHNSTCKKINKKYFMNNDNDSYFDPYETQNINKKRNSFNVTRNLEGL